MRKDEKYIKELLEKAFKGVGNFQRFEFCYYAGSARPDFVILDDKDFTYFEIKSEFDSFARFQEQSRRAKGFFTKFYLVIPRSKEEAAKKEIKKAFDNDNNGVIWAYYILEELEQGIINSHGFTCGAMSIGAVATMLWKPEKKKLIKERAEEVNEKPFIMCGHGKKTLSKMSASDLDTVFPIYFRNEDAIEILNKVFTTRNFDIF